MGTAICVVGAGGWGTALAILLAQKHGQVRLWVRNPEYAKEMAARRENSLYLPGVQLPPGVQLFSDLGQALTGAEVVVSAVPAQATRELARRMRDFLAPEAVVVSVSKGLEKGTHQRMTEVLKEELPSRFHSRLVVLSGPNHAEEVARNIPSATVVASHDRALARKIQELFMTPSFRIYTNADVVGVETGGALKNIIALASGISDGLGFGDNTKAALMTRGLAEITRLGMSMGAHPLTFVGLSGMGDLIATCTSKHSRNARAGKEIGQGKKLEEVLAGTRMVVEGVWTTVAAYELARQRGVEMPITEKVYQVLFAGQNPREAVSHLMERDPTFEEASYPGYT
ncbi:MAG: NAD(P)H-dependent glycerol-3-phosphate dehydrogenase [Bacillota bacterium]|nr:NAD(P)H-dependent glycerol-3-phosphate dehydrogenase [Bacillota bacterium]